MGFRQFSYNALYLVNMHMTKFLYTLVNSIRANTILVYTSVYYCNPRSIQDA